MVQQLKLHWKNCIVPEMFCTASHDHFKGALWEKMYLLIKITDIKGVQSYILIIKGQPTTIGHELLFIQQVTSRYGL